MGNLANYIVNSYPVTVELTEKEEEDLLDETKENPEKLWKAIKFLGEKINSKLTHRNLKKAIREVIICTLLYYFLLESLL